MFTYLDSDIGQQLNGNSGQIWCRIFVHGLEVVSVTQTKATRPLNVERYVDSGSRCKHFMLRARIKRSNGV